MWRFVLILLVAIGLAPGLFWREGDHTGGFPQHLSVEKLDIPAGGVRLGESGSSPVLAEAWRLESHNKSFGGFSALVPVGNNRLVAFSDAAIRLDLHLDRGVPRMGSIHGMPQSQSQFKFAQDIESATRDPETGQFWFGLEMRNLVRRTAPDFSAASDVFPPPMQGWSENSGAESFTRLADGRFLMISEGPLTAAKGVFPALMFAGDPVENPEIKEFRFVPPAEFRATDMAQIPDGRVLILLRAVQPALPPKFLTRIVIADPADIRPGQPWPWRELARLEDADLPRDNFEGLAVTTPATGGLTLWLISDDNMMKFQRTLLLKLEWAPEGN